jgi:hypothetical protein
VRNQDSRFDIREHLDALEPTKNKNFFVCPSCGGSRLGINPENGKYKCWSGDCTSAEVREAIRPFSEFLAEVNGGEYTPRQARIPKAPKKVYPPVAVPAGAKLLRLPAPGQPPRPERPKYFPPGVPNNAAQITYKYSDTQEVLRFEWVDPSEPKGRDKTYRQTHIDSTGKKVWSKGTGKWQPYRINEVLEALQNVPDDEVIAVVLQEGEPSVELARSISLASITLQGNTWNDTEIEGIVKTLRTTGKNIVLIKLRDNDSSGIGKAAKVQETCNRLEFPCIVIDPRNIHPDIPEAGDIREILEAIGADEFLSRLSAEIALKSIAQPTNNAVETTSISSEPDAKDHRKLEIKAQWQRCRNYIPDYIINSRFFHTPEPAAGTITGIKSGLGTGKTQWLRDIIASNPEGKIIVIGSRNGLLLQTAEKCGFYHLDAHNGYVMFRDPNARLCLCFDSLLKLPPDIFEGATIILDEAESVTRHLLMSSTLKSNREAIKQFFTQACKDASRIILLDGHLTDYTVNLIAKLAGNKTVTKHLNEFKGNCPKVSAYKTEKATATTAEKQDYINKILASDCPVIVTDCSVAEAEALAVTLTEAKGPGLLICSKTSDNPDELDVQTNPDIHIKKYNWVILSPSVENGLDISIREKFTDVFGLFCGLLGVNSLIQMLRRVRHPINQISVFCPQIGLSSNDDKKSYYANQIKHQIEATISIESTLLCPSEHEEAVKADILRQLADPLFYAYCHYEAQQNLEKSNLREFLIEALRDGGYDVDEPILGEDDSNDHANKKTACKEQESQEIFNSPDITLEEAQEISRRNKARWPERCQAEKAFLKAKLPGIETTELWKWEFVHRIRGKDSSLLGHLENSWLFHNPEDAEYLQKLKWESGNLETFLPDHSTRWLKLKALHKLDVAQFLNPDGSWSNESPEIKKLLKDGNRKDAKRILGEPGKDGIKYVNKLLGLIGVKLISRRARGEGGKRTYEYFYQPEVTWKETKAGPQRECSLPEDWPELAELTAVRMSQKVEAKRASVKSPETVTLHSVDAVLDTPDFINNQLETSRTEPEPEPETQRQPETPQTTQRTGWAQRFGNWVRACYIGPTDGCQLRILIQEKSGWSEVLAWPDYLRWDETSC